MSIDLENPETLLGKVDAAWNHVEQIGLALAVGDVPHAKRAKEAASLLLASAVEELNEIESSIVSMTMVEVSYEDRAGLAYDAYCEAVGGLAFNGDPLPKWTEFRADPTKRKQSDAWIAAAKFL